MRRSRVCPRTALSSCLVERCRGQSIERHVEIADAIITGDADGAEDLVRAHMEIYSITTALAKRVIEWE